MTLLLDAAALGHRKGVAMGALRPLYDSLAAELEPWLARELFIPPEKARLSRTGGRCPRDGAMLLFDPRTPREHRCALCGGAYDDEAHYRYWIYWYQLALAERAVHGAVLTALGGDRRYGDFAARVLGAYAERYLTYPNSDNVLGPTRLFFSTYLESIWLLQIVIAADLLGHCGRGDVTERVREGIVQPSARLIASYDEGASNRQVWNNAALLAGGLLLGDDALVERAVYGDSGLLVHLGGALLSDGTWYEGENYHLFAHRGLWYGVTMAEVRGLEVPGSLLERFDAGFAAPLLTALPDLTLPARRDSQYGISLRQWRFAELFELGLARRDDPVLSGALHRLYADDVPRGDTGRWRSAAEVERNEPASSLSRAELGWRSLLHARPEVPARQARTPASVLLDAQGLAVFRREGGRAYVALDYGHSGGGHGHPDRLNVLLSVGSTRWLDDMGTGSYVDRSLHWYRSTLAHNAPMVNGASQRRVHGRLLAYDERGAAGWIEAAADGIAPGVSVLRRIVVMPGYLVDAVEWIADAPCTFALPYHADLRTDAMNFTPAEPPAGAGGLQDGFDFVTAAEVADGPAAPVPFTAVMPGEHDARVWIAADHAVRFWRLRGPGAPGAPPAPFLMIEAKERGTRGRLRAVWAWSADVAAVEVDGTITVVHRDGTRHVHRRSEHGWSIELGATGARSAIDLGGIIEEPESAPTPSIEERPSAPVITLRAGGAAEFRLEEAHYLRSEESWEAAGRPSATVQLEWDGARMRCAVEVENVDRTFTPASAVNPYDNEHPDVNGAGIQLYAFGPRYGGAWMLVPENGSKVRARPLLAGATGSPQATWAPTSSGYRMEVVLAAGPGTLRFDLLVNERPAQRERRRGQLVLSGAEYQGGWVYLRGDRHDTTRSPLVHLIASEPLAISS